jgi:putative ABC transport system permease protein
MVSYSLKLSLRSVIISPVLSLVTLALLGLGVAGAMTLITEIYKISGDPIPSRSRVLYYPLVDPRDATEIAKSNEPPDQLTWPDAQALLANAPAQQKAIMTGGQVTIMPADGKKHFFFATARYTTAGFARLFNVPLRSGSWWTTSDDSDHARFVVVSRALAEKVFGIDSVVGRSIRINGTDFRVVGVLDTWQPIPKFYDLGPGAYDPVEDIFIPFATSRELKLTTSGSVSCWGNDLDLGASLEQLPCTWIQMWVALDTPLQVQRFKDYLSAYSKNQAQLGRFQPHATYRLYSLSAWLVHENVVPDDPKVQLILSLGLLLACVTNASALFLVKCVKRAPELAIRRALGAPRRSIFLQLMMEAITLGVIGSAIAMLLLPVGIWLLRQQPDSFAQHVSTDVAVYAATIVLAIFSMLLSALFPSVYACRVPPARVIKLQ